METQEYNLDSAAEELLKRNQCRAYVEAQGQYFKLSFSGRPIKGGGLRGEITEFSASSRKRMLELLARLEFDHSSFKAFLTLTYPDREGPPQPKVAKRDRESFQKRLKRRFPAASAIWRREWEPRKSGDFKGVLYPHYHLIFFGLPFVEYSEINTMWQEIIKYPEYVRTEIKGIGNWLQAMYYVSKYMAKVPREKAEAASEPNPAAPEAGAVDGGEAACSQCRILDRRGGGGAEAGETEHREVMGHIQPKVLAFCEERSIRS
jgi:hypothetical protein